MSRMPPVDLDLLTFRQIVTELGPTNWLLVSDGTVLQHVRGGDGDDDVAGGGDGGEGGEGSEGGDDAGGSDDDKGKGDDKVEMTQAELDALIEKRVSKAKKAAEDEAKTKAEREKMDEVERLKAEAADREKADADAKATTNARIVKTEAKVAALAAKVRAEDVADFLKLVDLSGIDVDDDGEVDAKALKKAVDSVLAKPAYKAAFLETAGKGGSSGGDHTGGHAGAGKPTNLQEAIDRKYATAS